VTGSVFSGLVVWLATSEVSPLYSVLLVFAGGSGLIFVAILHRLRQATARIAADAGPSPVAIYFALKDLTERAASLEGDRAAHERRAESLVIWTAIHRLVSSTVFGFAEAHQDLPGLAEANSAEELQTIQEALGDAFVNAVDHVIQPLEQHRGALLNFIDPKATYFIEVFELAGDELASVACRASPQAIHHGRRWRVGDGHIGRAVQIRKPFVVEDLRDRPDLHQNREPTDDDYFRCTIAVPILAADNRPHKVHGAICVTSSVPRQFAPLHAVLLENLAQPLTVLFYSREFGRRRIDHVRQRKGL
jgi:GAF domain-containing protein